MRWPNFIYEGDEYDLSHLHPTSFKFLVESKDGKPEQTYSVNALFSSHCFTRRVRDGETFIGDLVYPHDSEGRLFCTERYTLSAALPGIVQNIADKKCFHTKFGTFFVIEAASLTGQPCEYGVFFKASKAGRGMRLNLFIQSAYRLDDSIPLKKSKPIKFRVIAYNTCTNRTIKA